MSYNELYTSFSFLSRRSNFLLLYVLTKLLIILLYYNYNSNTILSIPPIIRFMIYNG